jgi:hypothetical protein
MTLDGSTLLPGSCLLTRWIANECVPAPRGETEKHELLNWSIPTRIFSLLVEPARKDNLLSRAACGAYSSSH